MRLIKIKADNQFIFYSSLLINKIVFINFNYLIKFFILINSMIKIKNIHVERNTTETFKREIKFRRDKISLYLKLTMIHGLFNHNYSTSYFFG